jgi:hypothetical protein
LVNVYLELRGTEVHHHARRSLVLWALIASIAVAR